MTKNLFNFSYSTYSTYLTSQLWFYFTKIAKAPETDQGMQVYGDAGNVVHNAIEDWFEGKPEPFKTNWDKYQIDLKTGFRSQKLSYSKYLQMYTNAIQYLGTIDLNKFKVELKVEKKFFGMNFKGFIDLYTENGEINLYDWKTNSKYDYKMHLKQRLLYSWFIWKIRGKIPTCKWVYLKDMHIVEDRFTEDQLLLFEIEIQQFIQDIEKKGTAIENYSAGEWKNPFNKHYSLCADEVAKRHAAGGLDIHMTIKGNYVFFEGDMDPKLEAGIDFKTKFDLKDKYWIQQQVKKKARGKVNLEDVGVVHLYNKKFNCFPIGLLNKVTHICHEFGEYYNKKVKIYLDDVRDPSILNRKLGIMPEKLQTEKVLRDYQRLAIASFLIHKHGIINIATGGGKTFCAAEIIRHLDANTLWIIDRKELLDQTKAELESLLGIEVGEIAGGKLNIKGITIATIQSLHSKLPELQDYLATVNFVVVDEFHKSAAETYQKVFAKLPNTKYRLGLTATPYRDDGKDPIIFSLVGDIVYKITTEDLIKMGYLVKPEIKFYKVDGINKEKISYNEDYKQNISENNFRNNKICEIVKNNSNKKTIILTKLVNHGKILNKMIPGSVHIHGNAENRELIMESFINGNVNPLIATSSLVSEGIDIPNLDMIINGSANAGDVKSIQILGRILRIFKNKKEALYIDFCDTGFHTRKHSKNRIVALEKQGHKVEKT